MPLPATSFLHARGPRTSEDARSIDARTSAPSPHTPIHRAPAARVTAFRLARASSPSCAEGRAIGNYHRCHNAPASRATLSRARRAHALHMLLHIFTRVGAWQEAAATNARSAWPRARETR